MRKQANFRAFGFARHYSQICKYDCGKLAKQDCFMTLPKFAAAKFTAILVPLAYLVFYTPYGMDTTDFGYFYAYPWRILEGQIPYRDFFYIKPALPLYWHAFWLWLTPEKWQVLAGKAGFVVSMLASSWLGALTLGKMFNLRQIALPLPLLATCGFVFGVHSFPHMPWHTVDGVLFSAAALWLASLGRGFPAGILAACALLCKQSFLPVPIAVLVLLWFWQKRRIAMVYCLAALFASLAAVHIFLYANDALAPMREMTTGQLDINEALDAGILIYFRQNFWLPLAACLPWLLGLLCKKRLPAWLLPPCCYMAILCVFYIYSVMEQKAWIGFGASWPTLLMLIGAMEIFFPGFFLAPVVAVPEEPHPMFRASTGLGALLAASWCVAISGGYKIPAFFAVPLVFSLFVLHWRMGGNAGRLAWIVLAAGLVMFWVGYQYPYTFPARPLQRSDMTYDAGKIYPRASHVLVDKDMYERLAELKTLREKYGPAYKTLPGFSFAYYLNDDKAVLGSDWLIDWEINGQVDRVYQELLDKNLTVFMERDQLDTQKADAYDRAGYGVPQRVRKNWKIVDETPHFVVFQRPL